jgi:hypothetical protein
MQNDTYTAFQGHRLLVQGPLGEVLRQAKPCLDAGENLLIFEDRTGKQVDFDVRGTEEEMLAREAPEAPRPGPGRPRLGVTAREVTLLPRHWQWLDEQRGGASATLRRLVDEARKGDDQRFRAGQAAEAAGRFLTAIAGDHPHFEDVTRALYAADRPRFTALMADWPTDVRTHALTLAYDAFPPVEDGSAALADS